MKKMIIFILCTFLVIALTGCANEANPLTGEWKATETYEQIAEMNDIELPDPMFVFQENDKVILGGSWEGTYSLKDNKVTIIFDETMLLNSPDSAAMNTTFDLVKNDDGIYTLQLQGEDLFIKK